MFCLEKDELTSSIKEKNCRNGDALGFNFNDEGIIR